MKLTNLFAFAAGVAANPILRSSQSVETSDATIAPSIQELPARYESYAPGAKRAKVRYGPYVLPSTKDTTALSLISGEQGTMTGMAFSLQRPCSGDCSLLTAQAGLEYADGRLANVSTAAWLHHIVLIVGGAGRKDATCSIMPGERIFSSGIEQNQLNFSDVTHGNVKAALPLSSTDKFYMQYELMNMQETAQSVYVTIDFEYLPGKLPSGWKQSKVLWLDITGCPGISSTLPPRGKEQFTLSMSPWTSPWNAEVIDLGGHLHDGGTDVKIYQNDKVICDSIASYSGTPAASSASMDGMNNMKRANSHGPESKDGEHISGMTVCDQSGGKIQKGDKIRIDASYDFTKYAGMKSKTGSYTEIMGISLMQIAIDP